MQAWTRISVKVRARVSAGVRVSVKVKGYVADYNLCAFGDIFHL